MAYGQKTLAATVKETRKYSDSEMEAFNQEMAKYLVKKELSNGETVEIYDEIEYLKRQGALNDEGAVILKNIVRNTEGHIVDALNLYAELSEKIYQWKWWQGRQQFAERKRLEGLQELADQMTVKEPKERMRFLPVQSKQPWVTGEGKKYYKQLTGQEWQDK